MRTLWSQIGKAGVGKIDLVTAALGLVTVALLGAAAPAQAQPSDEDDDYVQPLAPVEDPDLIPVEPVPTETYQGPASYGYVGLHPIPYELGSGLCALAGAHSHDYPPFDQYLFREYEGYYYFIGDPADFGYAGNAYWYNGNHPVPGDWGAGYCYISWPHRHSYEATGMPGFSYVGNYWTYGGVFPGDYYVWRDFYWNYYGGYYRSWYFGNRYWSLRPPRYYSPAAPVRIAAPPGRSFARGSRPVTILPPPAYPGSPGYGGVRGRGPMRMAPPGVAGSPAPMGGPPARYAPPPTMVRSPPGAFAPPTPAYRPLPGAQPTYRAPTPWNGPAPAYRAPSPTAPSYSAPTYRAPSPSSSAPPAFRAPAPSYSAPAFRSPSFSAPPAFRAPPAPAPSYRAAPSYSAPPPRAAPAFRGGAFRR